MTMIVVKSFQSYRTMGLLLLVLNLLVYYATPLVASRMGAGEEDVHSGNAGKKASSRALQSRFDYARGGYVRGGRSGTDGSYVGYRYGGRGDYYDGGSYFDDRRGNYGDYGDYGDRNDYRRDYGDRFNRGRNYYRGGRGRDFYDDPRYNRGYYDYTDPRGGGGGGGYDRGGNYGGRPPYDTGGGSGGGGNRGGGSYYQDPGDDGGCRELPSGSFCFELYAPLICGGCRYTNSCYAQGAGYDVDRDCNAVR